MEGTFKDALELQLRGYGIDESEIKEVIFRGIYSVDPKEFLECASNLVCPETVSFDETYDYEFVNELTFVGDKWTLFGYWDEVPNEWGEMYGDYFEIRWNYSRTPKDPEHISIERFKELLDEEAQNGSL